VIIKVREDKQIPFRVAEEIHRSNPWASDWLKRYDKESLEGLRNRTKSGRPPELTEEICYQIKKELKESKQGWTTKTGGRVNRKEKRYQISLYSHIPYSS
jgi:transposase